MIEKIIFFVILAVALIAFILAVVSLINIRAKSGYSTSTNLQTAYDYGIGILVIDLFVFIFMIVATVYYVKAKLLNSKPLTLLMFIILFSVLGATVLGGLASVRSSETVTIVNLVIHIIEFILVGIFLLLLRKIPYADVTLGICTCGETVAVKSH